MPKKIYTDEEKLFAKNRKLDDKFFIGKFDHTDEGYVISDIRRSDFSKISWKPKGKKSFQIVIDEELDFDIKSGKYYQFTWYIENGTKDVLKLDDTQCVTLVTAREIVDHIHDEIFNYSAGAIP